MGPELRPPQTFDRLRFTEQRERHLRHVDPRSCFGDSTLWHCIAEYGVSETGGPPSHQDGSLQSSYTIRARLVADLLDRGFTRSACCARRSLRADREARRSG